ncbi:hypothetical protein ERC79_19575 [Rhodococcus sp. ABRD24]|uniref:hypothetical protein n=1 Tax=Rhodococcus sp. ABRD24 TaxID=2507582 RepID=UPI00103DCC3F|nr:hypothetical protein [Rhodococcus sp. ABRD24]QBJ97899.1 hypothetical protein ERC79_19575 [Rhodococcus sp. ABRD24]
MTEVAGWNQLIGAVDSGHLYLEPEVARRCAERCSEMVVKLKNMSLEAQGLAKLDGFGDQLPSGVALASKFERKATGGDYSLDQILNEHIGVIEQMRAVFEKIGAQYQVAEASNTQALSNVDVGF